MIDWGRTFGFALSILLFAGAADAQATHAELLSCSAEFKARAVYSETLGQAEAGYIAFLLGRTDLFQRLAEAVGPSVTVGCDDGYGLALGLVICSAPKDLSADLSALVDERLIELSNANRGNLRLETCMVDDTCAKCMRLFNMMVRDRFPKAWKTTPP